jgi:hypothetical protein
MRDAASMLGSLQHIAFVYQDSHHTLAPWCSFIAKFPHQFAKHNIPLAVLDSLRWWQALLRNPHASRSLSPHSLLDPDVWVDASTSWGIGLMVGLRWAAWQLCEGWKSHDHDIGWAEAVALELAVRWLCSAGFSDAEIVIHGDNTGVIGAFDKGCSQMLHAMTQFTVLPHVSFLPISSSSRLMLPPC